MPPDVWAYQVGGYQVCHKWLKDRAERVLSLDEVRTYCRIITALARTIEIQREIDALYAAAEGNGLPTRNDGTIITLTAPSSGGQTDGRD